jgi:2-phospho-L-lactate guanylyltransferase (CobY/MobA/RfbA family)
VIVPDEARDGSNVVVIGSGLVTRWRFLYGTGSFTAHVAQSRELGVEPLVVADDLLSLDLDTPHDLENPKVADQLDRLIRSRSRQ